MKRGNGMEGEGGDRCGEEERILVIDIPSTILFKLVVKLVGGAFIRMQSFYFLVLCS